MRSHADVDAGEEGISTELQEPRKDADMEDACRAGRPVLAIEGEAGVLGEVMGVGESDVAIVEDRAEDAGRMDVVEGPPGRGAACDEERDKSPQPGQGRKREGPYTGGGGDADRGRGTTPRDRSSGRNGPGREDAATPPIVLSANARCPRSRRTLHPRLRCGRPSLHGRRDRHRSQRDHAARDASGAPPSRDG